MKKLEDKERMEERFEVEVEKREKKNRKIKEKR
jgi:hypothetical protein